MDSFPFIKEMLSKDARCVNMWMKVQDQGEGVISFVGASRSIDLRYGSKKTHQLIIGEIIVTPRLVIASDDFRGVGLAGLATECDVEKWMKGDIIVGKTG